ncbi:MAG: hypothetical protein WAP74_01335 [Patescibacteria group bacterium]
MISWLGPHGSPNAYGLGRSIALVQKFITTFMLTLFHDTVI